jgi:hypothetical protein
VFNSVRGHGVDTLLRVARRTSDKTKEVGTSCPRQPVSVSTKSNGPRILDYLWSPAQGLLEPITTWLLECIRLWSECVVVFRLVDGR